MNSEVRITLYEVGMKRERRRIEGEKMHNQLFGSNKITQEGFNSYQMLSMRINNSEIQGSSEREVDGLNEFLALPKIWSKTNFTYLNTNL